MPILYRFLLLVCAHFLCDLPLQTEFIAVNKSRFVNRNPRAPWSLILFAHSAIHAGAVLLILGSPILALCELAAHFIIDDLKCAGETDIWVDQIAHILCKVVWLGLFYAVVAQHAL
jgi:hypothetical protein